MMLDSTFVRSQFPAFSEPATANLAFFENAGGSYACRQVIDRLTRFYRARKVQPYAAYSPSVEAGAEMDDARARLAAMLGVEEDELSFGPSTSQNTHVLACAFGQMLAPGDAIVVTNQDHEANTGVWRRLADRGIELREWQVDPETGALDPAGLAALLDGRVRLVAFPHASNILGQVNDAAAITALAHEAGAWVCVDGVSYAPHGLPDVRAIGADIYLFSTYKTYGPHQGAMVIRRPLADRLPNQGHFFNAGDRTKRFTPAGPDHAQVAACAGIADYVDALYAHHFGVGKRPPAERAGAVAELMRAREQALVAPLMDFLAARNDLRILGPRGVAGRVPTVSVVPRRAPAEIAAELAREAIGVGAGDFYAVRLIEAMGVDPARGVLRMSLVHYTGEDEVARLIAALDRVL